MARTPFGDTSDRRALYQNGRPVPGFLVPLCGPAASDLQFSYPVRVYAERAAPGLADDMGRYAFEEICAQWLRRYGRERLGLTMRHMGRYWSPYGRSEIDIMAELANGAYLFGECKWSANSPVGLGDYSSLQAKVSSLPEAKWRKSPIDTPFAVGGFAPELKELRPNAMSGCFLFRAMICCRAERRRRMRRLRAEAGKERHMGEHM